MRAPTARRAACHVLPLLVVAVAVMTTACNTCPFKLIAQRPFNGTLPPGSFAAHDVVLPPEDRLETDVSNASNAGERVDLWLTAGGCERLFDDPYPLASGTLPAPRCTVIIGPVASGIVSGRAKVSPGAYRLFAYAPATNSTSVNYLADVGLWGQTCRPGSLGPPR